MFDLGLSMTVIQLVEDYMDAANSFIEKPTKAKRVKLIDTHHKLGYIATGLSINMSNALDEIMIQQDMNKQMRHHRAAIERNREEIFIVLRKISDSFVGLNKMFGKK